MSQFANIEAAIEDFRHGRFLIVVDDENRENEGDLIIAAEQVTPEAVNFMTKYGRGIICLPITETRADELELWPMVESNTALHETAFTVSIDTLWGTTTGISAQDRARTIKRVLDPEARPTDFARPGHVFPLRARPGGVLRRAGHTEAVVDLARLAGLYSAGVLCEILDEDGSTARLPKLMELAQRFHIQIITIEDLIKYRRTKEQLVRRVVETQLPTHYGDFTLIVYETTIDDEHHLAMVKGNVAGRENVLVRVHSSCLTGDVLGSLRCDCGQQLEKALEMIQQEGLGVFLYLHQEGRGIGLVNKLKAYALQDEGLDTVEANLRLGFKPDLREYGIGAQILCDLGLTTIRLMTNNPRKLVAFDGYGLQVVAHLPIEVEVNQHNRRYLQTKREKLGHLLHQVGDG